MDTQSRTHPATPTHPSLPKGVVGRAHPKTPVTLDDLRQIEQALFQSPKARFTTTQRIFFEALLSDPNLETSRAAVLTGVPPQTAHKWVSQPAVRQALDHLLQQRLARLGIDKDALLLRIVDCLDLAMGVKPIRKVAFDSKRGGFHCEDVHETDLAAAARFTDILAKHFRLYSDDSGHGVQVTINLDLGQQQPQPPTAHRVEAAEDQGMGEQDDVEDEDDFSFLY